MRGREKSQKMGGSGSASSPFPFPAGGDTHRHLQKKKKTQVDLFKTFCSLFLPVRFSSADGKSSGGGLLWPLLSCCWRADLRCAEGDDESVASYRRSCCGWRCGRRWWLCGRAAEWSSLLLVAAVVGLATIVWLPLEGWSMETGETVLWCAGVVGNGWWWKGTAEMESEELSCGLLGKGNEGEGDWFGQGKGRRLWFALAEKTRGWGRLMGRLREERNDGEAGRGKVWWGAVLAEKGGSFGWQGKKSLWLVKKGAGAAGRETVRWPRGGGCLGFSFPRKGAVAPGEEEKWLRVFFLGFCVV